MPAGRPDKPGVDWERIEADYRAGMMTVREIADKHGGVVKFQTIFDRAQKLGWVRDIAQKARDKSNAIIGKKLADKESQLSDKDAFLDKKQRKITEDALVEAVANASATVVMRHRSDQAEMLDAAMQLVRDVVQAGNFAPELLRAAEILDGDSGPEKMNKLQALVDRAVSVQGRSASLKAAVDSALKVMEAQRVAWRLDQPDADMQAAKPLSDADRASRLATIMERARIKADAKPKGEKVLSQAGAVVEPRVH